jgi:hypothetical protein
MKRYYIFLKGKQYEVDKDSFIRYAKNTQIVKEVINRRVNYAKNKQ